MFLRYPDPSLCVTSRTIVSRKNFLWYQQKLKAIVDILFFGIILRCGYCPFRFHGCFYCYVMLVENTSKIITTLDRPRDWQKWFEVNILKKNTPCKRLCKYYILCHSETEDRQDVRFGKFPPVLNVLLLLIKVVVHQQQQQNLWWIHHRRRLLLWFQPKKGWVWNINSQSCQDR